MATAVSPVTRMSDTGFDWVASGCLWTGDSYGSTRVASMSSGVVYVSGIRVPVSAVTSRTFTASKDTYVDVDSAGTITYTEVTNNAVSPALAASNIRIAIVVTGASSIAAATSINQGQITASLPVASSEYYQGFDSLGNPIYNADPYSIRGQRGGTTSPLPTVEADVTGATMTFTLARRRFVRVDFWCHFQLNSGATRTAYWKLFIDGAAVTQIYVQDNPGAVETHLDSAKYYYTALASGAHTIKLRSVGNTGGTIAADGQFLVTIGI